MRRSFLFDFYLILGYIATSIFLSFTSNKEYVMRQKPYVGITGFMSKAEVELIMNSIPRNTKRLIMIGVLMSQKTFNGQLHESKRYPLKEDAPKMFYDHP